MNVRLKVVYYRHGVPVPTTFLSLWKPYTKAEFNALKEKMKSGTMQTLTMPMSSGELTLRQDVLRNSVILIQTYWDVHNES